MITQPVSKLTLSCNFGSFLFCVPFLWLFANASFSAIAGRVTIYRDIYGVPHIYGDSEEAVAFGHGYAQAEDRLETLLKVYLKAEGKMAGAFGEEWVEHDYRQRVMRHAEVSRKHYNELNADVRSKIEYFLAGVKRYMKEHPDEVPSWAPDPQPYHVVALSRYIIWGWPLGQAIDDLKRSEPKDDGRGSNQWVIGRRLSAEDCVIALIDPHVPWNDEWLFYESHLHGGDFNAFGFSIIGTPCAGLGHNNYLSWACTTGGPDTADVYEEEINPQNPLQYRYDGKWRKLQVETVEIKVKTGSGVKTVKREIYRTHHGPIVERRGNKAYAIKLAYDEEFRLVEQIMRMNKAHNLDEFREALNMLQFMPQNIMYGDIYGNIYYMRTGRVPIRPKGFKWDRPVPGNTSKTEWLGIHLPKDLVQILNPPAGFMQNCNISPGTMMPNSPLTPENYLPYIYNASPTGSNSRGRRFLELMKDKKKVTREDAFEIANDIYIHGADVWQRALVESYKENAKDFKHIERAISIIEKWDRRAEVDSIGMTLYWFWWHALQKQYDEIPKESIERGKLISKSAQRTLLKSLAQAVKYMQDKFGAIEVPWGKVFRGRRGDRSWPIAGVAAKHGLVTLRAVGGTEPDENGISYARSGQSCTTVVFLKQPVSSYSVVPYGQSEHSDSPHYTDQAEKLFSKRLFKPTWFQKDDMLKHVESKEVLEVPSLPSK